MSQYLIYVYILLMAAMASIGMILLKLGSKNMPKKMEIKKIILFFISPKIIGGATLYLATTIIFFNLLRTNELSYLYPLTALTYVFVMLLSIIYLKEKINKEKTISTTLIVLGMLVIGL